MHVVFRDVVTLHLLESCYTLDGCVRWIQRTRARGVYVGTIRAPDRLPGEHVPLHTPDT